MKLSIHQTATLLSLFIASPLAWAAAPANIQPYGATPTQAQLAWHDKEMYAFVHFTTNTFTDKEWGFGDESPEIFNPSAFDADQIVRTAANAGMKGLILTCKHHDGFCLWPTKTTKHSVASSKWKNGKGDVVKEISEACKKAGIAFGIYVSPWDRNHAQYGTEAYLKAYQEQLRELLTNYGPLFMVWHDGANGGDGFYGGANEKRSIDRSTYYQWPETWSIAKKLQPNISIFSDVGPDVRWIGNEHGAAGYPCWATYSPQPDGGAKIASPGMVKYKLGENGTRNGDFWIPAEVDVSIRPGWFWHEAENQQVRSPENLFKLYFTSVGRGANLNLNLPPDRRGMIHENDQAALKGFRTLLDQLYAKNFAEEAQVSASSSRTGYSPNNILDRKRTSFWIANTKGRATLTIKLPQKETFDVIRLGEPIQHGQRIESFAVFVKQGDNMAPWLVGSSIGAQTLLTGKTVTTDTIVLQLESPAPAALSELSLWKSPINLEATPNTTPSIQTAPTQNWQVLNVSASATDPKSAFDGNPKTLWHTHASQGELPPPQHIDIDMAAKHNIKSIVYTPRQDGDSNGIIDQYAIFFSQDGKKWTKAAEGEFSNIKSNPIPQIVTLKQPIQARYMRFIAKRVVQAKHISVAEIGIITE